MANDGSGTAALTTGWYVVSQSLTLQNVTVSGTVNLILGTGCTLTVEKGIISGFGDGSLQPGASATRVQVAAMVQRLCAALAD